MPRRPRLRRAPQQVTVPINRPSGPPPGPEVLPWYWHPDRDGAQPPPRAFAEQLAAIDPDLRVCFSPVHERWILWVKNPRIQNAISRGWQLLMIWEHARTHEFLPLTELLFHNIALISGHRYPNAEAYFDRIQADIDKVKEAREKAFTQERQDRQKDMLDSHKISSAGAGNKAALHGQDEMYPSPGTVNYLNDTRKWRLPKEMLDQEKAEKERAFY